MNKNSIKKPPAKEAFSLRGNNAAVSVFHLTVFSDTLLLCCSAVP